MDDNFVNQLLNQIATLEKENTELKAKIKEITLANNQFPTNGLDEFNVDDYLPKNNETASLHQEEPKIKEIEIKFTPMDSLSSLSICGDFTNWEKQSMRKISDNSFTYTCLVLMGYDYAYCFYSNNDLLIDFEKDYMENEKKGLMCNYLTVPDDGKPIIQFQPETDMKILEREKTLFLKRSLGYGSDDLSLLKKAIMLTKISIEKHDLLNKIKENAVSQTQNFYDSKLEYLKNIASNYFPNLDQIFKLRVISILGENYIISGLDLQNPVSGLKCVRMADKNGVKVNFNYHINNSSYESYSMDLILNSESAATLYSTEESLLLMNEIKANKDTMLRIFYHLVTVNSDNPNTREIVPYKTLPEGIDLYKDYSITISENKITDVRSKEGNLVIDYEAIMIKDDQTNAYEGLVPSSELKLYTTMYNKDIMNIIHVHLNDTSQEITVDSVFLNKNENPEDYKHFLLDVYGKKLLYKFIFRDYKLLKIYYNVSDDFIDEPKFEEIKIKTEQIVKISAFESYQDFYGKITRIPIGMLSRKDINTQEAKNEPPKLTRLTSKEIIKEGYCFNRHLEELPGFVDIELLLTPDQNVVVDPFTISIPLCKVTPLGPREEINITKILIKHQFKETAKEISLLDQIYQKFLGYEKYLNEHDLDKLNAEETKELINYMEGGFKPETFTQLVAENEEALEKYSHIMSLREKVIPLLCQHLRLLMLTSNSA